ncbi:hypothetical protein Mal48_33240 [Thalassoglobus polymorphus]|uniref:Uncharacterized protein n=1 Tax=Thalassoglobus polymorphus TaxID=2527994 RepID=A0A517QR30_9PLAN|nr:hypothetical protein Mal48_33240 [Thalassoglobus polymorphus]
MIGLSLIFAHAPVPFRRLGILYAAFGVACGAGLKWFMRELSLKRTPLLTVLAVLIVFTGGGHLGWVSYQNLKSVRTEMRQQYSEQLAMLNFVEGAADEETKKEFDKLRREFDPAFGDYLEFRVSPLGSWKAPWPLLLWLGELTIASAIAVWILTREPPLQDRIVNEQINQNEKVDP